MSAVWVLEAARSPWVASLDGTFALLGPEALCLEVGASALIRSAVPIDWLDSIFLGLDSKAHPQSMNAFSGSLLTALGRPRDSRTVPTVSVDQGAASGLEAAAQAARRIALGQAHVSLVASVSVRSHAAGRGSHGPVVDGFREAERWVQSRGTGRHLLDEWAQASHDRAQSAHRDGRFSQEITPIDIKVIRRLAAWKYHVLQARLQSDMSCDEARGHADLASSFPVLAGGVMTRGHAAFAADGACACVLVSDEVKRQLGVPVLGRWLGETVSSVPPEDSPMAMTHSIAQLSKDMGMRLDALGLWEIDESLAPCAVATVQSLGLARDQVNVDGGDLSLGLASGVSGLRMMLHALHEARRREVTHVGISVAAGQASAQTVIMESI